MKKCSLGKTLLIVGASLIFCSSLEAAGASKTYKVSVTIPAICHAAVKAEQQLQANVVNMQIAMEQDTRDDQKVMVRTAVPK